MRKIALLIIILFPLCSIAQKDTVRVENGGVVAIAYPKTIGTEHIMFDEKIWRIAGDTAKLDSGSVYIMIRPELGEMNLRTFGLMEFENITTLLYKSYILIPGLQSGSTYDFKLVLTVGTKTEEKLFKITTVK